MSFTGKDGHLNFDFEFDFNISMISIKQKMVYSSGKIKFKFKKSTTQNLRQSVCIAYNIKYICMKIKGGRMRNGHLAACDCLMYYG
jgi:hypothetical protein